MRERSDPCGRSCLFNISAFVSTQSCFCFQTALQKFISFVSFFISRPETYISRPETHISRRETYVSRAETKNITKQNNILSSMLPN